MTNTRTGWMIVGILMLAPLAGTAQELRVFPPPPPVKSPIEGAIDFHVHSAPDVFGRSVTDIEAATHLYRIAQEGVANARKHAHAGHVMVRVASRDDGVTIVIEDDGVGFDASVIREPLPGHLGLTTMVERAELLGGWCRVTSGPGSGTRVECWLPSTGGPDGSILAE